MPESNTPIGRGSIARDCRSRAGGARLVYASRAVVKVWLTALAAALVLVAGEAPAAAFAKQDVLIPMDDGVSIAATLYVPDGAPPAGGWPALVFLHGLSGRTARR